MKTATHFDVIVVGVGSMGAATCYYLAKKGKRVLGLEQFEIPHEHGSHAGQSRIIRKAYFEHPDYVPLLEKAYRNWAELERVAETTLFHRTGLFYAGVPQSPLLEGTRTSAAQYGIEIEEMGHHNARFPQFVIPPTYDMLFEPDAGFVLPERTILTLAQLALQQGAVLLTKQKTLSWELREKYIEVRTAAATFTCDSLVVTAGAWAGELLPHVHHKLKVTRQVVAWFQPHNWQRFALGAFPCWLIAPPDLPGAFYGFPVLPVQQFGGPIGLKIAYHYPGQPANANAADRGNTETEARQLAEAVARYLPGGGEQMLSVKTCLYTNTPDEHFVIDFLPNTDHRVVVAAGFSGHGFKFVPGLGETLADMAIEKTTTDPIGFLSLQRFAQGS